MRKLNGLDHSISDRNADGMFVKNPLLGSLVVLLALLSAGTYSAAVNYPGNLNFAVIQLASLTTAIFVTFVGSGHPVGKTYVVVLLSVLTLSAFRHSYAQPEFSAGFIIYFCLHFFILLVFIFAGERLMKSPIGWTKSRYLSPGLAALSYLALGVFVAATMNVRLGSFLEGKKVGGDLFRIPGVSGLQGVLMIFSLCTFSLMSWRTRSILVASIVLFAIADVKRGEIMRVIIFLFFLYGVNVGPRFWRSITPVILCGMAIFALVIMVSAGELRQALYSENFSINQMLDSRLSITAFDWLYGYIGINASVLQKGYDAGIKGIGFVPTLLGFIITSEPIDSGTFASINGFNAGTVFAIFSPGDGSTIPSWDFLAFCVLVFLMMAAARGVAIPSIRAFWLTQIFLFSFGNQFILPYIVAGYALAITYLQTVSGIARRKRDPIYSTRTPNVPDEESRF